MNKEESPKSLQKWVEDFATIPNAMHSFRPTIYENVFKVSRDPKLIWFQYRINHRILGTNYLLKKMSIRDDENCSFCLQSPETLMHLFWHCEVTQKFWKDLIQVANAKCNLNMENWSAYEIMFGSKSLHRVINLILLHAKLFLYYNKMKNQRPCLEAFIKRLTFIYKCERFNAIKNDHLQKFETLWEAYINLVT